MAKVLHRGFQSFPQATATARSLFSNLLSLRSAWVLHLPDLEVCGHCSLQAPSSTFLPCQLSAPSLPFLREKAGIPKILQNPSAPCHHCPPVRVMSPTLTASIPTSVLVTAVCRCLLSTDLYIQSHPNTSPNALQDGLAPKPARLFSCLPCSFF